jgi:hypothetical protein
MRGTTVKQQLLQSGDGAAFAIQPRAQASAVQARRG